MLKLRIYILPVFIFLIFFTLQLSAQLTDNIIWATLKVEKSLDEKTSMAIAPIFRINEDISNYQNMSVDVSLKRKFGKGWWAQVLGRTWFIPDQKSRQFLWFDLGYGRKMGDFQIASRARIHYALDINDRDDPDFLRWQTRLSFLKLGKVKPFFAIEPWFRLNEGGKFQRIRYEPGVSLQMASRLNLSMVYRRENSANLESGFKLNMYVITLAYNLSGKKNN